jgi:hypothetical protein
METALWILVAIQLVFNLMMIFDGYAREQRAHIRFESIGKIMDLMNESIRNLNSGGKWQYTWCIKDTEMGSWEAELNSRTDDGWELVSVVEESTFVTVDHVPKQDHGRKMVAYFKRKVAS